MIDRASELQLDADINSGMDQRADHARSVGSETHLRSILATVPDAMVIIDEHGIIISFSAAAEKMFGYAEDEVVGENVSMLMPSPDREQHDGYLKDYRDTGVRKIIGVGRVTTARRRDGNTFPIELSVGEASVDGARIFTGFIHDLTARREADVRVRDLQAGLAHVGRLSEMGTLASSLAHELNQPLTAITSYCEGAALLLDKPDAEQLKLARGALQDAAEQAVRAGQIVRRMREFLTHGEAEHGVESLAQLVTEANALALVGSREHGIEVQVQLDPKCNHVFVDRIQIQQVLFNLIRNAIDAMMDGPVRSLSISSSAGPDGFATVSISDTGSGISPSVKGELFQPFVTSKQSGMGVGLSICRSIIEAHGGRIWFEPGRDGGTIFRFTLPKAEAVE